MYFYHYIIIYTYINVLYSDWIKRSPHISAHLVLTPPAPVTEGGIGPFRSVYSDTVHAILYIVYVYIDIRCILYYIYLCTCILYCTRVYLKTHVTYERLFIHTILYYTYALLLYTTNSIILHLHIHRYI